MAIASGVKDIPGRWFRSPRKFLSYQIDAFFSRTMLFPEFTGILDSRVHLRFLHEDNTFTKWQSGKNKKNKQRCLVNRVGAFGAFGASVAFGALKRRAQPFLPPPPLRRMGVRT